MTTQSMAASEIKMDFAVGINGVKRTAIPEDLFIPPDALEILLDSFCGPLDLLLYLIRKQNIDVLNIPIVSITTQYMQYIQAMGSLKLELAAEYLLMAAVLAEIKAKMLLPLPMNETEEEDPRSALVQKLQVYEQMKQAAQYIDALPRQDRDHFLIQIYPQERVTITLYPEVVLADLVKTMSMLQVHNKHHYISRQAISVQEKMSIILFKLQENQLVEWNKFIVIEEGRTGLVVYLLAILELAKLALIVIIQAKEFSPIYLQAA